MQDERIAFLNPVHYFLKMEKRLVRIAFLLWNEDVSERMAHSNADHLLMSRVEMCLTGHGGDSFSTADHMDRTRSNQRTWKNPELSV